MSGLMWNLIYLTLLLLPFSSARSGKDLVDYINKKGLFKAVYNPSPRADDYGQLKEPPMQKLDVCSDIDYDKKLGIPESFDSAENWPHCADVINVIRDQSRCGNCWAVSAASMFSDRICIATNGTRKVSISSYATTSCSKEGDGCIGRDMSVGLIAFKEKGLPTGSEQPLREGCQPYPFKRCTHDGGNSTKYPSCQSLPKYEAKFCAKLCQEEYPKQFKEDLYFAKEICMRGSEESIQREIMIRGPIIARFRKFESFQYYKSGIYRTVEDDKFLVTKSVRVVGWGVENGTKYWKIANSYNEEWGEQGYFRLIRGESDKAALYYFVFPTIDLDRLPK